MRWGCCVMRVESRSKKAQNLSESFASVFSKNTEAENGGKARLIKGIKYGKERDLLNPAIFIQKTDQTGM